MLAVTLKDLSGYSSVGVHVHNSGPYPSLSSACQSHSTMLSIPAPLRERCGTQDIGHVAFRLRFCLIYKLFTLVASRWILLADTQTLTRYCSLPVSDRDTEARLSQR